MDPSIYRDAYLTHFGIPWSFIREKIDMGEEEFTRKIYPKVREEIISALVEDGNPDAIVMYLRDSGIEVR